MKIQFNKILTAAVLSASVVPLAAHAGLATWRVNYEDANTAGTLGIFLNNTVSELTDEYKFTLESAVAFHDNDGSNGISQGDTFDDYVGFVIDQLNKDGSNTFDLDNGSGNTQISGTIISTGFQLTDRDYIITNADIEFYFDGPQSTGTLGVFSDFDTLVDGILVQSGIGRGTGSNGALAPDGNINIKFDLTDVLSTLGSFGNFELFDPFIGLDEIVFTTDSNNHLCDNSTACAGDIADMSSFFGFNPATDYDFVFHTRSDGSGVKVSEPENFMILAMGLIGFGISRRRMVAK